MRSEQVCQLLYRHTPAKEGSSQARSVVQYSSSRCLFGCASVSKVGYCKGSRNRCCRESYSANQLLIGYSVILLRENSGRRDISCSTKVDFGWRARIGLRLRWLFCL